MEKLDKSGIITSLLCNLKCKHCIAYAPYYEYPFNPTLEYLKQSIDKLFDLEISVGKFSFSGGEPLLSKDLGELVDYCGKYKDRIDCLEIVTNGTLLMDERLISVLKKYIEKVDVLIDDYIVSDSAQELAGMLENAHIKFRLRDYKNSIHMGGWCDMTDFSLKNDHEMAERIFDKCCYGRGNRYRLHTSITDGKIYACHFSRRCDELGVVSLKKSEFVDLFDGTETREEKSQKLLYGLYGKHLSACLYCRGAGENFENREIPALQID